MCEPVSIGLLAGAGTAGAGAAGALGTLTAVQTASLALSAGSAAMGAAGAYQQAKSTKQTANYNAQVAEIQAQDARARGDAEASRVRRQGAQLAGAQRAGFAAKGIDFGDGSAADALDQTDFFSQIDQNTARDNAAKEAWNLRARKASYEYEARAARPGQAGFTTLLGSAPSVADKWLRYSGKG